jgi:hypothetical protein
MKPPWNLHFVEHFCELLANEQACKIHIDQKVAPHWYADLLEFHSVPAS